MDGFTYDKLGVRGEDEYVVARAPLLQLSPKPPRLMTPQMRLVRISFRKVRYSAEVNVPFIKSGSPILCLEVIGNTTTLED